ncbi:hypothetical protein FOQG_16619 [Fusarium oxysporum f. sp. raphani 54005]|uniref:Uncharacterized protein n=1 Tax=Fusarium oxysporum f. sp. raphani 54005 TaxID=1089458 RepID=X0BJV8_FUSOX|nr:hypothetical protein FOQG_16619 [Fusarium oxysporum f. sp. raphani 54005]
MPVQLLPASAAAFAPRASSVNVALGSKVEPSLTQTLKRINRVKRPLNSVLQHQRCLTETLSSPNAIWTLTSLMLPKTPESGFKRDASNHLFEAIMNYELVHVEAYVVHVDMVLRNEVSYKLTKDTIDALVEYHKEIHCVDAKASTYDWTGKEQQFPIPALPLLIMLPPANCDVSVGMEHMSGMGSFGCCPCQYAATCDDQR